MIESYHEHKPAMDDLRVKEIEDWWESCRGELANLAAVTYSGDENELRQAAIEADAALNHLLEEMVPELLLAVRAKRGGA